MRRQTRTSLQCIASLVCCLLRVAQSEPKASIEDIAWLAGHWQGEALGGLADEYWSEPMGGAMMGMFRLIKDGHVVFYELFRAAEESGNLVIRLKHFHPDMKGWEEKGETVVFPLVKRAADEAEFGGMSLRKTGPDSIDVVVLIGSGGRHARPVKFAYRRVRP